MKAECGNPETDPSVGTKINASLANPVSVTHAYPGSALAYNPKVIVERGASLATCDTDVASRLVDIKVRGTNDSDPRNFPITDGPVNVLAGNKVEFVWETDGVRDCVGVLGQGGYPEWTTAKSNDGSQVVQIFGGRNFAIQCKDAQGNSVADSVWVNTRNVRPSGQHLRNDSDGGLCRAVGFVSDPNSPKTPVSVRVYADGGATPILTTTANQENAAGFCVDDSTTCGFYANLRGLISEGVSHMIRVVGIDNESSTTTVDLVGTPKAITCGGCVGTQCTVRCIADPATGSNATTAFINQNVTLQGAGGSGSPSWSGGGNPASATNAESFTTAFSSTGVKTVTYTRGGQDATCSVNVTDGSPPPPPPPSGLTCSASPSNPSVGESVTVTASGGTSPYKWLARGSSQCTTQCPPSTEPLVISYGSAGTKMVTSTDSSSPTKNTNCSIVVGTCSSGSVGVVSNIPTTWTLTTPNGSIPQAVPASEATYTNQPNGSYQLVGVPNIAGYTKNISPAGAQSIASCGESITFVVNYTPVSGQTNFWIEPPSKEVQEGYDASYISYYDPDGSGPIQKQTVYEASEWSSNSSHAAFKSVSFLYGALFTGVSVGPATITAKYTPPGLSQLIATAALNVIPGAPQGPPGGGEPSWSCSIYPSTQNASPGDTVNYAVTVDGSEPFAEPINLSVVGLPADILWSFTPARINFGETSVLTLAVGDAAQNGAKPFSARCVIQGTASTKFADANVVIDGAQTHLSCDKVSRTCGPVAGPGVDDCSPAGSSCAPSACDLTARPSVIYQNGSSMLQWRCGGGISSCSLSTAGGVPVTSGGANGEFTIRPQTTTKYNLSCDGGSVTDSVTVRVFKLRETPPQ